MNTKSKIQPAILTLLLLSILLPMLVRGATNQTIYQTGFEPPAFTPGLPIRGQDNWEMFHDGEAISISTNNARSGTQCVRMDGALLEQTGPNSSAAFCFSKVFLDNPPITPPPIVELTAYVRLDGPQTGTDGASTNDLMSANFSVVTDVNGALISLGQFLVSSAGRIFTWGSRTEDRYKYSAPMTFGAYQKLVLRVDFVARTVRYFANDIDLGSVPFAASITTDRLVSGYLVMSGPVEPLTIPYHYDPADYTAYFDDYSIVSVPPSPVNAVIEFASTNVLTDEFRPTASVLVIRRGFTNAAVRVTVSTTNGTALANEDYEATTTFVTFAAGETNRMVEIPLHDDYWAEPDKTFLVRLTDLPPGSHQAVLKPMSLSAMTNAPAASTTRGLQTWVCLPFCRVRFCMANPSFRRMGRFSLGLSGRPYLFLCRLTSEWSASTGTGPWTQPSRQSSLNSATA